jgi:hypothetical protein
MSTYLNHNGVNMEDRLQHTATASIVGANDSDRECGGTVWARVAYGFLRPDRTRKNLKTAGSANLESLVPKVGGQATVFSSQNVRDSNLGGRKWATTRAYPAEGAARQKVIPDQFEENNEGIGV